MSIVQKLKPQFWDASAGVGPNKLLFNFRRIWHLAILLLAVVALAPLMVMTFIDYNVTRHSLESENLLRTARTTSNTRRTLAYFLNERKQALDFIAYHQGVDRLHDHKNLEALLEAMKNSFGGFVDLSLINEHGQQVAYVGPYKLLGRDYSKQEWFLNTMVRGNYTSSVFLGFRGTPHLIIARKITDKKTGESFVLRATLDTEQFNSILSSIDLAGEGEAFVVNNQGIIQTPTRWHGKVLSKVDLPLPEFSESTSVEQDSDKTGIHYTVGYAYVLDTPFIVLVVKRTSVLMRPWQTIRIELLWILAISIFIILLVIVGVATYMVDKIFVADQTRARTLHQMEHTNRMASIGRLAAGVAHEINNPLAIINEKAGLINDLFTFKEEYAQDRRLQSNINSIIASVERCGKITKRLLSFARHIDMHEETIHFKDLAEEVIGFLQKEAEYRSISIKMNIQESLPEFISDRGKLQQIFLNLVNNAFQAMNDGGHLTILAKTADNESLVFAVEDDGCGIPEADLKHIFDPFFSTKKKTGGTGLGLSITFGLIQELGGSMAVESTEGKGTKFTITMPLHAINKEVRDNENTPG